ncbi:hypothetical protein B0T20DRAFT_505452 [Sordaria brevicollis]|uniref:Uncharacterized protein n=1 Tax=Sordaria brevicollis TaxID=83679 RepID=A0AAE0UEF4_SORBR|nr:hypothetical protein B0T20DRAFT_505452 [Sordaria brevicollis]
MPLDPLQPPFVPTSQTYMAQERTWTQEENPQKKNNNKRNNRIAVTESQQEVEDLVTVALDLTWDTCFDGTQVIFKEPETLTVFREELHLDPFEEDFVRFMADSKRQNLVPALKLRDIKALEADKLFMKISPMDCRLKREQDPKMQRNFKFYKHILHAPKSSDKLSVCIPSHPWPQMAQPLTCLHCNLTSDYFNIYQLQLSTYILFLRPPTSRVKILHNQDLCAYHDYYLHTGQSLGYHELVMLDIFHKQGILFGNERGRTPDRALSPDKPEDKYGEQSHLRYFIDRLREEVLEGRGHLVTTEEDLKVGTFLKEGKSRSKDVFAGTPLGNEELECIVSFRNGTSTILKSRRETTEDEERVKRLGVIGDRRPVVRKSEETEQDDEDDEDNEDDMGEVGPPTQGASLIDTE